jgi:hypothetical protein
MDSILIRVISFLGILQMCFINLCMVISYCTLFIELSIVVQFSKNFDTNLSKCDLKHFPHGVNAKSTANMFYMVANTRHFGWPSQYGSNHILVMENIWSIKLSG